MIWVSGSCAMPNRKTATSARKVIRHPIRMRPLLWLLVLLSPSMTMAPVLAQDGGNAGGNAEAVQQEGNDGEARRAESSGEGGSSEGERRPAPRAPANFVPSERIGADVGVDFPADI